jgi:O-antigen/teichoic acid export membrane protein
VTPDRHRQRRQFASKFSSAVICQALLSAANLAVGLILIRRASNAEYGLYILAFNAISLMVTLQTSFFSPQLNNRLSRLEQPEQRSLIGGFYREQRRLMRALVWLALPTAAALWLAELASPETLHPQTLPLLLATALAALAMLHREFFRTVLFAQQRPQQVLRTDVLYVVVLVGGALAASLTRQAALVAVLAMGVAALLCGRLYSRQIHRQDPWDDHGAPGLLREIAPLAAWATAGAAIHWTFSQGYIYLVAGTLGVTAVAAISATRLLMMPINLLSVGIGSSMMPLAARWLHQQGGRVLFRRLCLGALGMALTTLAYFAALWLLRDWIFGALLKKQFDDRDALLLLWGGILIITVVRDQFSYFLIARGRFQVLAGNTLSSALLSLTCSYFAMLQWGTRGALIGMMVGEGINLLGVITLTLTDPEMRPATPPQEAATEEEGD